MGWNPNAPKTFRDPTAVRTFKIPRDPVKGGGELPIHITEPDLKAQGLSLETWAASSVQAGLIQRLTEDQVSFPPSIADQSGSNPKIIPILELGAGTGMVGISAAIKWNLHAVLTDLAPIVPGLAANIALNRDSLTEGQMSCGALDWSEPARLDFHSFEADGPSRKNPFEGATAAHLVLAADTIYSEEHPPLLAATVLRWLSRADPTARFVMCLPLRACYLDELRDLWSLLETGGLECIQDGQEMADQRTFDDECLCEWSIWRWKPGFRKEG